MTPLSIGTHYEHFVRHQLACGHFDTVSELMCEALRLLEERQLGSPSTALPEAVYDQSETRAIFAQVRDRLRKQAQG